MLLGHKTILNVSAFSGSSSFFQIVGSAKLRRREHENKTGGNPFLDHALIFSRALHLRVILDFPTSRAHRHVEHSLFAGKSALKCV